MSATTRPPRVTVPENVWVALIAAVPATVAAVAAMRQSRSTGEKVEAARSALADATTATAATAAAVADVHHEMRPNSGGSLRDAVDRLEREVASVSHELRDTRRAVDDTRTDVTHSIEEHTDIRREIANGLREHDAMRREVRGVVRKEVRAALSERLAARRSTDAPGNVD